MSDTFPGKGIRLLIGFAESLAAIEVCWSLQKAGFDVYAFCRRGANPPLRKSRVVEIVEVPSPELDALGCVGEILAAAERYDVQAVMPLDDFSLWLCAKGAAESEINVIGATGSRAALALDKEVQIAAASLAGLTVPRTVVSISPEEAFEFEEYPAFLKSAEAVSFVNGRLSKGKAVMCADKDEARKEILAWDFPRRLILQPLIRGVGEGVFGLATARGIEALSAHRRIRMMNPEGSGSSACESIAIPESIQPAIDYFLSRESWKGMFMIELLRGEDGRLWFMELNGRPWGSMALARRQGLEYPAWAACEALGLPSSRLDVATEPGVICRHLGREVVHLMMVMRGPKSRTSVAWPGRLRTISNLTRLRPNTFWYNVQEGDLPVFLSDTFQTVWQRLRPGRGRHG